MKKQQMIDYKLDSIQRLANEVQKLLSCKYDVGDCVVYRGYTYYIFEINVHHCFDSVRYDLTAPKNDGTMPEKCMNRTTANEEDLTLIEFKK